jgi:hypothetical protein
MYRYIVSVRWGNHIFFTLFSTTNSDLPSVFYALCNTFESSPVKSEDLLAPVFVNMIGVIGDETDSAQAD